MESVNIPQFEYQLYERTNGKKFIKVLTYSNTAEGYIEIARINEIKSEWAEKGFTDIEALYDELVQNSKVTNHIARTNPSILTQKL